MTTYLCAPLNSQVGGLKVLDDMEAVPTDGDDRPVKEIKIISAVVYMDPFKEIEDIREEERTRKEREKAEMVRDMDRGKWYSAPISAPRSSSSSVGKYLPMAPASSSSSSSSSSQTSGLKRKLSLKDATESKKKKITSGSSFQISKW